MKSYIAAFVVAVIVVLVVYWLYSRFYSRRMSESFYVDEPDPVLVGWCPDVAVPQGLPTSFQQELEHYRKALVENPKLAETLSDSFVRQLGTYQVPLDVLINLSQFDNDPDSLWNTSVTLLVLIFQKLGVQDPRRMLLPQNVPHLFKALETTNPQILTFTERRTLLSAINNLQGTSIYGSMSWPYLNDVTVFYEKVKSCDMS